MVRISLLHSKHSTQAFCVPARLRRISATGELQGLPWRQKLNTITRLLFSEHTETPRKLAFAVGIGFFCGIAPIWGFQMIAAAALAHRFRLNKAIAVTASNISFPLATPFVLAGGLLFGHFLHTGALLPLNATTLLKEIPLRFAEWFFGSIALGILVGVVGAMLTWLISRLFTGKNNSPA
jgi:uncharacterized protein (DUF2062 family)